MIDTQAELSLQIINTWTGRRDHSYRLYRDDALHNASQFLSMLGMDGYRHVRLSDGKKYLMYTGEFGQIKRMFSKGGVKLYYCGNFSSSQPQ